MCVSGLDVFLATKPERRPSTGQDGVAGPREHRCLPQESSQHDQGML